jgi:hypothetical protein
MVYPDRNTTVISGSGTEAPNKALHRTGISLHSIAAGGSHEEK